MKNIQDMFIYWEKNKQTSSLLLLATVGLKFSPFEFFFGICNCPVNLDANKLYQSLSRKSHVLGNTDS